MSLKTLRLFTFLLSIFIALAVLGLAAHVTNTTHLYFAFDTLAIFSAAATLLTLFIVWISAGVTSWVIVELSVTLFLSALWLATAAYTAAFYSDPSLGFLKQHLSCNHGNSGALCGEIPAVMGLAFVDWLLLMAYGALLFTCAIRGKMRGHKTVWTSSVNQGEWLGPSSVQSSSESGLHHRQEKNNNTMTPHDKTTRESSRESAIGEKRPSEADSSRSLIRDGTAVPSLVPKIRERPSSLRACLDSAKIISQSSMNFWKSKRSPSSEVQPIVNEMQTISATFDSWIQKSNQLLTRSPSTVRQSKTFVREIQQSDDNNNKESVLECVTQPTDPAVKDFRLAMKSLMEELRAMNVSAYDIQRKLLNREEEVKAEQSSVMQQKREVEEQSEMALLNAEQSRKRREEKLEATAAAAVYAPHYSFFAFAFAFTTAKESKKQIPDYKAEADRLQGTYDQLDQLLPELQESCRHVSELLDAFPVLLQAFTDTYNFWHDFDAPLVEFSWRIKVSRMLAFVFKPGFMGSTPMITTLA